MHFPCTVAVLKAQCLTSMLVCCLQLASGALSSDITYIVLLYRKLTNQEEIISFVKKCMYIIDDMKLQIRTFCPRKESLFYHN